MQIKDLFHSISFAGNLFTMKSLQEFYDRLKVLYHLRTTASLLTWDEHTCMPSGGLGFRAEQKKTLASIIHDHQSDPTLYNLTQDLLAAPEKLSNDDLVNLRETLRSCEIAKKLPAAFVTKRSLARSTSYAAWLEAKEKSNFSLVQKPLNVAIELMKEEAEYRGYDQNPYDALFQIYEPYSSISTVKPLLLTLADSLKRIISQSSSLQIDNLSLPILSQSEQERLIKYVAQRLGYPSESGQLSISPHPFQSRLGPQDVRITTRYDPNNFLSALFASIHEMGHAFYALGMPQEHAGTPRASSVSLGIDEAMSRFWENIVGRSEAFCSFLASVFETQLPTHYSPKLASDLYAHLNNLQRCLIRIESDEVSYSLHIVIRMLLEEELINSKLKVQDLPERWKELYKEYLDLSPPDDSSGCLQDIHWFIGAIGYFPTYALGNIFGAMMQQQLIKSVPDFETQVAQGEFKAIRDYLDKNIATHGQTYSSFELIERLCNKPVGCEAFTTYLSNKFPHE